MAQVYKDIIRLTIDLKTGVKEAIAPIKQADNLSRVLRCQLINNGKPINLKGSQLLLYVVKADYKQCVINGVINESKTGIVDFELTEQSLILAEEIQCEIVKIDEGDVLLSFPIFKIGIDGALYDNELVESTNEFSALTALISNVASWENRFVGECERIEKEFDGKVKEVNARLSQVNSLKVGNGVLASISDLGQDVKEAMLKGGANIPIVGTGAINNTNVNIHQITPDKLTKEIVLNVADLPIGEEGKYINDRGEVLEMRNWYVHIYKIPNELKSITFNGVDITYNGIIKHDNGKIEQIVSGQTYCYHNITLYINRCTELDTGIKSLNITYLNDSMYYEPTKFNLLVKENFFGNGYMKEGQQNLSRSFAMYKIPVSPNMEYFANLTAIEGYKGTCFNTTNDRTGEVTISNGKIVIPENTSYIIINISTNDEVWCSTKSQEMSNVVETFKYSHCIQRPFDFNGKTSLWFGDSITRGSTSGSVVTENGFPKLFSDHVGMTYKNHGQPGALFTSGFNSVETIVSIIKRVTLTSDFIFIAGGTNDFGLGVPTTQFRSVIKELCQYLSSNYSGKVIFITPINRIAPSNNEQAPLQVYRNIITEEAMLCGFSVVDGSAFNFPITISDYQQAVMPDKLHPSELGYSVVYKNGLVTYLC